MKLSFKAFSLIVAAICCGLAVVWLAVPQLLLNLWGVKSSEAVGLLGRRSAALFLGIGIMFFVARGAGPSLARQGLLAGLGTGCAVLASLGLYELLADRVGAGILVAVVTELVLASGCLALLFANPEQEAAYQIEERRT